VTREERDGIPTLRVAGEIDIGSVGPLEAAVAREEERAPELLVIDLREVTFMDSTGLNLLVTAHKRARERGGNVRVLYSPGSIDRFFQLLGIQHFLDVTRDDSAGPPSASTPRGSALRAEAQANAYLQRRRSEGRSGSANGAPESGGSPPQT
jgi:anti-sigma B factor antagonist